MDEFKHQRKSYMEIGEIFFFTATINHWRHLLQSDHLKLIIINSLQWLSNNGKLDVFAFVIMPNHIHVIWRTNTLNGKESVQGSFLKYTAHEFKKYLLQHDQNDLEQYAVKRGNKMYEFWQRDSLAIHLYTKAVAYQKMDYLHFNPLAEHWKLATDPSDYYYSSAAFYEKNDLSFAFLKDLRKEF